MKLSEMLNVEPNYGHAPLPPPGPRAPIPPFSKDALMDMRTANRIVLAARRLEAAGYEDVAAWMRRKLDEVQVMRAPAKAKKGDKHPVTS